MRPVLALALILAAPLTAADPLPPAPQVSAAAVVPAIRIPADAALRAVLADARAGRLEPLAAQLPAELQRLLAPPDMPAAAPEPAPAAGGQGGARANRMRRGLGFNPLARLADLDEAGAKDLARELAGILAQVGERSAGAAPAPGGGGRGAFMGTMIAGTVLDAVPRAVLADGLETRQVAAIAAFWAGHAAWAKAAKLEDDAVLAPSAAALLAFAKEQGAAKPGTPAARAAAALAGLGHALRPLGLDGDAAFASATVTLETPGEERAVVLVTFTAYGREIALPLRLAYAEGAWRITADSPLLRWLPAGMGGFGGFGRGPGGFGGPGRGNGNGNGNGGEAPPAEGQDRAGGKAF